MKRSYFLQGILLGILAAVLCFAYNTYLMPVGSINGQAIYRYQVRPYVAASSGNAVKSCAKDKLFYEAVNRLGVTVPDTLVESELQKYAEKYGGRTELENILLDTTQDMESIRNSIKKSLIHQKALDYYISKEAPSADEVREYYDENAESYPKGFEEEYSIILSDLRAVRGQDAYNAYMEKTEKGAVIKVY